MQQNNPFSLFKGEKLESAQLTKETGYIQIEG